MDVGIVKVAEDKDFENLKTLIDNHDGWKIEYNKPATKVWTKTLQGTNFKMVKVASLIFNNIAIFLVILVKSILLSSFTRKT